MFHSLQLSLGFLILFIAFNSTQNLQAKLMNDNGFGHLGNYNLACVSVMCIFGSFMSTTIIKKLGVKWALVLGAIGDT